jgi:hypothetical protein
MQRGIKYTAKLVLVLFLFPSLLQAACTADGYTVVFVNGIFNTKEQAQDSTKELKKYLGTSFNSEIVSVRTGYNPTHALGLGDLTQLLFQSFATSISDFDLNTILLQIHPEVTTRKLMLVGHSQGTFYTNSMYDYLLNHGEPKASVGVYNVATPANYVAGGGHYLTSNFDALIKAYADYTTKVGALTPLPPNAYLGVGSSAGNGHNFINNYLAYGGERMVAEIQQGLSNLKAEYASATGECFTPPPTNLGYKTTQVFFAIADPTATGVKTIAVVGYNGTTLVINGINSTLAYLGSFFGFIANNATPPPSTPSTNTAQGGAVALAVQKPATPVVTPKQTGEVQGATTEKPFVPLIPPPNLFALPSPGYGGGGGGGSAPPIQTAQTNTVTTQPTLITYTFTVTDLHGASAECSFDDDAPTPCEGTFSATLDPGPHTFTITATDAVGNQSVKTRHFTVE